MLAVIVLAGCVRCICRGLGIMARVMYAPVLLAKKACGCLPPTWGMQIEGFSCLASPVGFFLPVS